MVMTDGMTTPDDVEKIRRMTALIAEIDALTLRGGSRMHDDLRDIRLAIAKWREESK